MQKTNAIRLLERCGATFAVHEYTVDEEALDAVSVARAVGFEPERVFKTLVARGDDGAPLVFCIPGNLELDLGKAARASGRRRVALIRLRELQPLTGYIHGGCSPFAMKKELPTWIDESAALFDTVLVSGGARGLQVEIAPDALTAIAGASVADLTRG